MPSIELIFSVLPYQIVTTNPTGKVILKKILQSNFLLKKKS